MRKIRYSAGVKGVVLCLQQIFSVLLVICIILVTSLLDRNMLEYNDLKNKNFLESGYYQELFRDETERILQYIEYKKQFETDGVYNPGRAVNIMAYHGNNNNSVYISPILTEGETFRYYLEDLENWSKDYEYISCRTDSTLYIDGGGNVRQTLQVFLNGAVICELDTVVETIREIPSSLQRKIISQAERQYGVSYRLEEYPQESHGKNEVVIYSEVETQVNQDGTGNPEENVNSARDYVLMQIREGQLFQLRGEELQIALEDMQLLGQTITTETDVLAEVYETVDGSSILDEFINGNITANEMLQAYGALEYTLENISQEITAYKRLANRYEKEKTNFQFMVYSENAKQFYTNMDPVLTGDKIVTLEEKLLSLGKELGSYFYYRKDNILLDSTVEGMEDYFYEKIEPRDNGYYSELFIGVDTDFPHKDSLANAKEEYNQLQPWAVSSLILAGVSLFGWFFCFVYLSIVSGRGPEDTQISLNWFDRIKTEILILGAGIFGLGSAFLIRHMIDVLEQSDIISTMIVAGVTTVIEMVLFMVFYLSFVRRMKAGVMWSGSILCWVMGGVQKVIRNWKPSLKILVACGIHFIITLILGYMVYRYSSEGVVLAVFLFLLLFGAEAVILLRQGVQRNQIMDGIKRIAGEDLDYKIDTSELTGDNKAMGETINTIGEGLYRAVDENMKNERLKTDLITNVSHDIKTPLTSIINYVDLLKREDLENQKAKDYIHVLDAKSQRLKQLTEDLVEASKISSGNISLQIERLNLVELVHQTAGEFSEKFEARGLTAVMKLPKEPVMIMADGRRIWRVIENLYNNVAKYALENTRVYVDMEVKETVASFSIKNISKHALNIDASELTERFIRGDVSRSTEGSGLGLSIAQNLTQLMGGTFDIYLDGDLFKVTVTFPVEG